MARHHVEQKSVDELQRVDPRNLDPAVVAIVLVVEHHLILLDRQQPVVVPGVLAANLTHMLEIGLVEDTTMPKTINGVDCPNKPCAWHLRSHRPVDPTIYHPRIVAILVAGRGDRTMTRPLRSQQGLKRSNRWAAMTGGPTGRGGSGWTTRVGSVWTNKDEQRRESRVQFTMRAKYGILYAVIAPSTGQTRTIDAP